MPSPKVFVAWGGPRGQEIGERLRVGLRKRNVRVFISSKDMVWGETDWEAKLRKTIATSDAFVLVCTREACCSWDLMKEIIWAESVSLIMPLKLDGQPLHPHPRVYLAHAHEFNSLHPNYDAVKRELLKGLREFRRKIAQAKTIVPETGATAQ